MKYKQVDLGALKIDINHPDDTQKLLSDLLEAMLNGKAKQFVRDHNKVGEKNNEN